MLIEMTFVGCNEWVCNYLPKKRKKKEKHNTKLYCFLDRFEKILIFLYCIFFVDKSNNFI